MNMTASELSVFAHQMTQKIDDLQQLAGDTGNDEWNDELRNGFNFWEITAKNVVADETNLPEHAKEQVLEFRNSCRSAAKFLLQSGDKSSESEQTAILLRF